MKRCPYCEKENSNSSSSCWFCGGDIADASIRQDTEPEQKPKIVQEGYHPIAASTSVQPSRGLSFFLRRLFDFRGRAGRGEFILIYFGQLAVLFVLGLILAYMETILGLADYSLLDPFSTIAYFLTIIISLAAIIRRFHDLGHSGWAVLLLLIPVINIIMFIYLLLKGGTSKSEDEAVFSR